MRLFFFALLLIPTLVFAETLGDIHKNWTDVTKEVFEGATVLDQIDKPFIAFFGGHLVTDENPYYQKAFKMAKKLAEAGFVILTGGDEGIMRASHLGALTIKDKGITSVVIEPDELKNSATNEQTKRIPLKYFFPRKWLLAQFSSAYVIFPGGIGTLDEMTEVLALISAEELPKVPLYVIGTEYWDYIQKWFKEVAVPQGMIKPGVLDLLVFTDDVQAVEKKMVEMLSQTTGSQPQSSPPSQASPSPQ